MKKKEKPNFLAQPNTICTPCNGRGEVKDEYVGGLFRTWHWTYKRCAECKGVGENHFKCMKCKELLTGATTGYYCTNENCDRCGLITLIYYRDNLPIK